MRIGSQLPRVEYRPPGAVDTLAEDAILLWELTGLTLDPWQEHILDVACSVDAEGKWTAFEVGLEAPRQNGKTAAAEAMMLTALFFWDAQEVLYSAHEFKTAVKTFRRLERLVRNTPVLMAQVETIRYGNDDKSIVLKDGSVLQFVARSGGSGRGFSSDMVFLDEAYNLSSEMMAASMPMMSAKSMDGNPQIWFLSSAGMVGSHYLNGVRKRALAGGEEALAWMEWSSPKGTKAEDVDAWYEANPALGIRISEKFVRNELSSFRSDPELGELAWLRERLGIRESVDGEQFFDMDRWQLCADPNAKPVLDRFAFALDVPPDRSVATISMVALLPNGDVHVEMIDRDEGTSWAPRRLRELQDAHGPKFVVVDAKSAAAALLGDLRAEGVRVKHIAPADYAAAAAQIFDMVHPSEVDADRDRPVLVHIDQKELTDAVAAAVPRYIGDGAYLWSRKNIKTDISPLVGVTLALAGLQQTRRKQQRELSGRKPRRKAVMVG